MHTQIVPSVTAPVAEDAVPTAENSQPALIAEDLYLLGNEILKQQEYGEPDQQDVADRTTDIVCLGLEEKEVKTLLEVLIPPNNCKLIDPSKVNIEAAFRDASARECDKRIVANQMKQSAVLVGFQHL